MVDPIAPIPPRPPDVPPLNPALGVRKTSRDSERTPSGRERERRRGGEEGERVEPEIWRPGPDDEDDGRPHIDVTV